MHYNNYKPNFKDNFNEYYSGQPTNSLPRFLLIKEFCKDAKEMSDFVPFVRERDKMNRLVRMNSEKNKLNTNSSKSPSHRNYTPDQFWQYNKNQIIPESRKRMSFKFNYQIKMEPKVEQVLQPLSTQQGYAEICQVKTERNVFYPPIEKTKRNNKFARSNKYKKQNQEPKKQQIAIPIEILQPYINQEMEQMKQDLFFKVDQDYQFPSDLSEKLIQQKKHIENLKKRLKEWGEMKTEEDIEDLKQHAKFILSQNT